jgi:twinfilin-like protein
VSNPSQRGLLVTITNESLTPIQTLQSKSDSFNDDLSVLAPHLEPKTALYIILRRYPSSDPAPFVAITYVPDSAPVRQKTLFASTRLTLVRELGIERFRETIYVNSKEELTKEGFEKHDKHVALEAPRTEEERSLEEVKRQEAEEGRGAGERKRIGGAGLSMPVTDQALDALKSLNSESEESQLVQLVSSNPPLFPMRVTKQPRQSTSQPKPST